METIDNKKIAMSLLRQCAWVWEHCTINPHDGEFRLSDLLQGMRKNGYKSAPGRVSVEASFCKCWDVFGKTQPIEGLTYIPEVRMARLDFGSFTCRYRIEHVFEVTADFCRINGCSSLVSGTRFAHQGTERWTVLPGVKKKAKAGKQPITTAKKAKLSFAEQLQQVLQARLAA